VWEASSEIGKRKVRFVGALGEKFERAGSKRAGYPPADLQRWPVFEEYAETEEGEDIILEAVVAPVRLSRPPELPPDMAGFMTSANWHDAEERSVKRYIAPLTQHKDLFHKFARYIRVRPAQEPLDIVRAWISEYGVLGLAGVDDPQHPDELRHPGRRESVRRFWRAARDVEMTLDLYEAAIPKNPGDRLSNVLRSWEPEQEWAKVSPHDQREHALRLVGNNVSRVVKNECYPQVYCTVNEARNETQGFVYDFGFHSLLGAMYLQMMLLLTDANNIRQCQRSGCYGIIPPGSYKNRIYCSGACKQWVYDNRET
jgi:hypothetical protein